MFLKQQTSADFTVEPQLRDPYWKTLPFETLKAGADFSPIALKILSGIFIGCEAGSSVLKELSSARPPPQTISGARADLSHLPFNTSCFW